MAAMGTVAPVAATENPGGTDATSSPWLAQTRSSLGICEKSLDPLPPSPATRTWA